MRVDILGPVQVTAGDGVVTVPRRVERALLAVLALHAGQVVRPETLTEAVWAGDPPVTAIPTLRSHMSRLRQRLGPDIARPESGGYRMVLPDGGTDIRALKGLLADGAAARKRGDLGAARELLASAEQLWRGPPLIDLADGPARTAQVERLRGMWWKAREGRLCIDLDLGRHEQVLDEARDLVAEDPLHEGSWRLLIMAQYRAGEQIDALRSYRRLQGLLADEWGVDPSPGLQRLYWQVLRQDPQLDLQPPSPPLVIPAAVSSFVGRVGQIEAVGDALQSDRMVTLHGPAGVGKTRLAQEVARAVHGRFADGVWWVDLTVVSDLPGVLARLAGAIGVPVPPSSSARDVIVAHLLHRELLLVLDNCEQVAEHVAAVALDLLQGAPGLRILATSRVQLGLAGVSQWEVPPLQVPEVGADEQDIVAADAVVLFQQRRGRRADTAEVNSIVDVADLCRQVDGVPLALELLAGQARHQSVREIAVGLESDMLDSAVVAASTSHHLSLRRAIDWSYSGLDALEQHLFDRLAVFPGDFDLNAVQAVATGIADLPQDEVLAVLSRLVGASLVQASPDAATTRYRLLFVIREFARDHLAARGEVDAAGQAFTDHYRQLGLAVVPGSEADGADAHLELLGPELENLRAAFRWSARHEPASRTLAFVLLMGRLVWAPFLDIAAELSLLRRVVTDAVDAPAALRGWGWLGLVTAAYLAGNPPAALDACDRGQALFEEVGDRVGLAAMSQGRGVAQFLSAGDLPAAEASFRQGRRLARAAGAATIEAWVLAHFVQLQCYMGPPTEETHSMLAQAQRLCRGLGDPLLPLQLGQDEATVAYCEGDFDGCIAVTERLESLSARTGSQAIWGQVALLLRGAALLGRGEPEAAQSVLLRAASNELDGGSLAQFEILLQALAPVADRADPVRAARLWGAGSVHVPVWPGLARFWFPSRARAALGERFDDEVEAGRALSREAALDLAVG